jgi:hypothetical protein
MRALRHYAPGMAGTVTALAVLALARPSAWWQWLLTGYSCLVALIVVAWFVRGWMRPPNS